MAKKEFIDKKLIARMTSEVLLKVISTNWITIQSIADKLPHSYEYIRSRLHGEKGNYELYEQISVAIWKSTDWYRQLNIDICIHILKHDQKGFVETVVEKMFDEYE